MSDPVLAEKDPALVLAEALQKYKDLTGVTLAPADPRRLHLQAFLALLAQQRQLIDFSGKQSLLRFVSDQWIAALAELWGEAPLAATPSIYTEQFTGDAGSIIENGKRVTDGTNVFEVIGGPYAITAIFPATTGTISAQVQCTVPGTQSNGLANGQIATLVDDIPGVTAATNTAQVTDGRDLETTEAFRTRLRSVPESRSTCGPRVAYEQGALDASPSVADAVALGPDDGGEMAGYPPSPGEVFVLITEGTRDANGVLLSTVPDPSSDLLALVLAALSAEDVRPLTDHVFVLAPTWVDYNIDLTYYVARSREDTADAIEAAVTTAVDAFKLWQSSIGRDINPSQLIADVINAGAKRVVVNEPSFSVLQRDEAARIVYVTVTYGGIEDD